MDWANTHTLGMESPDLLYSADGKQPGYYVPSNPGFWYRELLDARYAGLQFVLPNVYGPDVQPGTPALPALEQALDQIGGGIQVGMVTDSWAWGKPYWGSLMDPAPDLNQLEESAQRIYQTEWKPFFSEIAPRHWYRRDGRPLIYFYNAGTLLPKSQVPALLQRMSALFQADFGVAPFLVVDHGYQAPSAGDGQFRWYTLDLPGQLSRNVNASGLVLDNFMVRWDSTGRDFPGKILTPTLNPRRPVYKGPEVLEQALASSQDADLAFIATWNDLGEGTGFNRNYDYYYQGRWLEPDAFMTITRNAQCAP
jgi:hypothetical protein